MRMLKPIRSRLTLAVGLAALAVFAQAAPAEWVVGPQELVQAGGADIVVPGYSVPSFAYWNDDGLRDLIVGEGGNGETPKVRVYLNVGTASAPQFDDWFYVQSYVGDLTFTGPGCPPCYLGVCMGLFPRVVYWDADGLKDLLVGQPDGSVKVFTNVGSEAAPTFDVGTVLQVGEPGAKVDISVGGRATPIALDWNNDGRRDLLVGALDGKVHIFLNEGSDTSPDFRSETFAQRDGADLLLATQRTSPHVLDADGDGRKDLLLGETNGHVFLFLNVGTDAAPSFSDYTLVMSGGLPIVLPSNPRTRPFVCDWTGDGLPDLLVGAEDGKLHLYQGIPEPAALALLAAAAPILLRRKRAR